MSAPLSKSSILFRQRLLRQAGYYTDDLDGLWGRNTEAASVAWEKDYLLIQKNLGRLDTQSEERIRTILPLAQVKARELVLLLLRRDISARVVSGVRTYDEQTAIYAQGRTKPGKIVTHARAGQSNHHWGLAWDIGIFTEKGKYLQESPLYDRAVELSRVVQGIARGADWPKKRRDRPHYEIPTGLSQTELRRRFEKGIPILETGR